MPNTSLPAISASRPEKDHAAQLQALHELFSQHPEYRSRLVKLVLIGGARNDEDAARVVSLRSLAGELAISVSLTSCPCFNMLGIIDGDCVPLPHSVPG